MTQVCQDLAKYAGWSKDYSTLGLGVHGIFLDETPNLYAPDVAEYLNTVYRNIKDMLGILGDRLVSNSVHKGERF
jgi:hypothetical protein